MLCFKKLFICIILSKWILFQKMVLNSYQNEITGLTIAVGHVYLMVQLSRQVRRPQFFSNVMPLFFGRSLRLRHSRQVFSFSRLVGPQRSGYFVRGTVTSCARLSCHCQQTALLFAFPLKKRHVHSGPFRALPRPFLIAIVFANRFWPFSTPLPVPTNTYFFYPNTFFNFYHITNNLQQIKKNSSNHWIIKIKNSTLL